MGADGHTASLFPGSAWDESRLVVSVYAQAMRAYRVTMTPLLLNAARQVIFLVAGEAKASALRGVITGEEPALPAGRIRPSRGKVLWMVDRPAASRLPQYTAGPQ
jgi:6-phosphogluconolactonase